MIKIGFFLRHSSYLETSPAMNALLQILRMRNVTVETIAPDAQPIELQSVQPRCDLYLLKPGSEANLSLAGVLETRGARVLNDYHASVLAQDKIQVTARLIDAKLPVPESFVCGDPVLVMRGSGLRELFAKPHRGSYGEGVEKVVGQASLVGQQPAPGQVRLMQQALPSKGLDTKVYVIGDEVFAIKRPFPAVTMADKLGQPCVVSDSMRRIALAVGRLLGLKIYGIDMLETARGYYIVDVNFFPSFIGVEEAPARLADYIINYIGHKSRAAVPELSAGRAMPGLELVRH